MEREFEPLLQPAHILKGMLVKNQIILDVYLKPHQTKLRSERGVAILHFILWLYNPVMYTKHSAGGRKGKECESPTQKNRIIFLTVVMFLSLEQWPTHITLTSQQILGWQAVKGKLVAAGETGLVSVESSTSDKPRLL